MTTTKTNRLRTATSAWGDYGTEYFEKNRASAVSEVHSYPHLILRAPDTIRCFACFRRELTPAWTRRRHNDALKFGNV